MVSFHFFGVGLVGGRPRRCRHGLPENTFWVFPSGRVFAAFIEIDWLLRSGHKNARLSLNEGRAAMYYQRLWECAGVGSTVRLTLRRLPPSPSSAEGFFEKTIHEPGHRDAMMLSRLSLMEI